MQKNAYACLIVELAAYKPPLDREGFAEVLRVLNTRVADISVRPSKCDMLAALEAVCRVQANLRFAELGLKTRF